MPAPRPDAATADRRRAPGRPPVPREDIVAAALAIVDDDGLDALSLRALAQRLGSGTATLYRHFEGRSELLAEVADRVLGELRVDADAVAAGWEEACRELARALFGVLCRHRNAAPLLAQRIPLGPNAMAQRELALGVLLERGFSPGLAVGAYTTISRHVLGYAMQLSGSTGPDRDREAADVSVQIHELDAHRFPATVALADLMPVPLEKEFEFGLDLIIEGLAVARAREESA